MRVEKYTVPEVLNSKSMCFRDGDDDADLLGSSVEVRECFGIHFWYLLIFAFFDPN